MSKVDVSEFKGPLGELMDQCSPENGGRKRFEEFNLWLKGVTGKLLKHLRDVGLGPVKKFEAAKKFTKNNPLVKFWDFGTNFTTYFGNRVEKNVAAMTIAVSRLERRAKDPEITNELAGETKRVFRISLAHFYQMIETQGQVQADGPLLVNGYANIAYIEDMDNWAVNANWNAGYGWYVHASPVGDPNPWDGESQVLSRKSA